LDADTILVIDHIGETLEELAADEREYAATMSRARRREFAAGRTVARQALRLLQHSPGTGIPMGMGGEPIWPQGMSGSLSHTSTHAAALIARATRHGSVGVDLDDQRLLGTEAAVELMTRQEIDIVIAQGWAHDVAIAQNLVFLAKESLFKYQYPITGRRELDFDEVSLHPSERSGVLTASCAHDPGLQRVLAQARIFHLEIQGLRICWTLPLPHTSRGV
jgi:4'-phosphopantetheinyl transferase EntD